MEITSTISPEIQQIKQRFSIIGNASALMFAVSRAKMVAPYDQSVLITGESGVGKEFFPKIIHAFSPRKHNKYIAVNCGAIPEGTIDSELFGHEKGSFTGAISSRKGYFEEADGGTIFLDEVAELPLTTQARLLRVLENGEFIKVGSSEVQKTNIRVVAATNMNMLRAVSEGKFREDLYYRLSTVTIEVPALRERGNDILLLTRKFATDFSEKYRIPPIEIGESAKDALLSYRWPGNVRQLKNVIEQVALFKAGEKVESADVKAHMPLYTSDFKPAVTGTPVFNYTQERELLFKMMFRMQKEIDDLRNKIDDISHVKAKDHSPKFASHIEEIDEAEDDQQDRKIQSLVKINDYNSLKGISEQPQGCGDNKGEMIQISGDATMTLEDTEREIIKLSLQRNCGKRKKTADELHISERTLYRKIKEYGLE
ncbi:MAG: sigma-54 dependent transcriptional regulator [Muribaculaceae bacterium]|nr:sigma-54 dependent transcriptional regulator [Muribaculaceae bacterium]